MMKHILAILGLFAITASSVHAVVSYDLIPSSNGPAAGGNTLIITNYSSVFGSDITNVVFSNSTQVVSSTNIPAKDTKWVCVIVPAHAAGEVDIVVQSSDAAEETLSAHKYTYNPAGYIGTEWGETTGLPTNRYCLAAGVLSGEVYAVGGYPLPGVSNVYRYCGANWTEAAGLPMPTETGRYNMAVGVCSGLLYAVSGAGGTAVKTNVYTFNGTSWTETVGLPAGRSTLGVGVLNGQVYAVGGYSSGCKTNVYRFTGSSWTQEAKLPSARARMGCVVFNDRLYVVGGFTNTVHADPSDGATNVFMFDGANWTEVVGLPAKRGYLTACVWKEWLYAIGGQESTTATPTNSVYRYDGTSWESVAGLPAARAILASATVDNQMLAIGGFDGSSGQTNVYYYPSGGVSPSRDSCTGGYAVTISGENLGNGSDVTNVSLCGVSTTNFTSQSATQIVIIAAAGAPGLGDVRVYSISYGETVKSNGFTYSGPFMSILGTNGAVIASGASADAGKGTDFGSLAWDSALTNTFAITNSGNTNLTISGVTTNGAGAAAFSISDPAGGGINFPFSIDAGNASNFNIRFAPPNGETYTAAVEIANDSATTPYIVYLAGTGSKQDQVITSFTPTNGAAFTTTSTVGLAAQASSGLTVTNFTVGSGLGSISGLTNLTFTGTGSVSIVASRSGDTNWNAAPNVTNIFNVLPAPTPTEDGWLVIQVTPVDGTWQLTSPAGYTGPTAGTGNLAAVSAITGEYGIAYGALSGYVVPSNQTQFVTGGSTSIFSGVYLQVSTNIGTPAGVAATGGTYTNKIRISWQGVAGALGYEIWRSRTNSSDTAGRIADIPENSSFAGNKNLCDLGASAVQIAPSAWKLGNTYIYDDSNIVPIYSYYYWVRAKTATLISLMSYVGMGYAALSPDQMQGTADIAVSDMVYLPVNVTNLSCAGTVSCRLANLGPDAMSAAGVEFDFQMGASAGAMVWIGSAQSNLTLSAGGDELIILTPSAKRGLTVRGDLSGIQQVKVVVRHLSALNDPNPANNMTTAPGTVLVRATGVNSPGRSFNDYDGDGKADGALCATNMSAWAVLLSGTRYRDAVVVEPGQTDWIAVPGDYEGVGRTGAGVYVPDYGLWYVWFSSDGGHGESGFLGGPDYTPIPCDFDGDAKTDPVVYREADGYWMGAASSRGYVSCYTSLGGVGYQPVFGDYDGDGLADPAVYNRATGLWVIGLSSVGYQLITGPFGGIGYLPANADYDGDGLADPAIYDPDTAYWQVLMSGTLSTKGYYTWWGGIAGNIGGIPVPADYDGDGKADLAVYHQDTGIWDLFLSNNGYRLIRGGFGGPEYAPVKE